MQYLKVSWHHSLPDGPVVLYSEIDEQRWERRKVYLFREGPPGIAGLGRSTRSVFLATERLPSLSEIVADREFTPVEISREEFEAVWATASKESG
jgi:hypothetical protein